MALKISDGNRFPHKNANNGGKCVRAKRFCINRHNSVTVTDLQRGFTLIEMLVVITIIVVIASITIPMFMSTRATTRRSDATNAVRAALAAARQCAIERRTLVAVEFFYSDERMRGDFMALRDKSADPDGTKFPSVEDRTIGQFIKLPEFIKFGTPTTLPPSTAIPSTLTVGWEVVLGEIVSHDPDDNATPPVWNGDIAFLPDGTVKDPPSTTTVVMVDKGENTPYTVSLRVLYSGLVTDEWNGWQ